MATLRRLGAAASVVAASLTLTLVGPSSAQAHIGPHGPGSYSHCALGACANGTLTLTSNRGAVRDVAGDGTCVQVRTYWYRGGTLRDTDFSPWACPDGDSDSYAHLPGDGTRLTADYAEWAFAYRG